MTSSGSRNAEDFLYGDDANFSTGGGVYDPYQESGSRQWLYNDTQPIQAPQTDLNTAGLSAGADSNASYVGSNHGAPAAASSSNDEGWETDEIKLRNYFSRYGNIVDCTIMRDPMTGRPRGFGFVTFDNMKGVNAVLQEPSHNLDGKAIDPKHAVPRDGQTTQRRNNYNYNNSNQNAGGYGGHGGGSSAGTGGDSYNDPVQSMKGDKVFVGGLSPTITETDLTSSFAEFGSIVEAKIMIDRETGLSRKFGFIQFETEDAALEAVKAGNSVRGIVVHGQRIDVKPAVHKKRPQMPGMGMMGGAGASTNAYGMMGMPGYGMMGMPGYGMMGMPGYGMMGMMGANGSMDYSAAMNYGNFYGNMAAGYYGGNGAQGDGSGADASNAAAGYYGQMGMPNNGYYGGNGADAGQLDQSSGVGDAGATGGGSGERGSYGKSGGDQSGPGYYDQQDGGGASSYSKGSRQGDDRGSGRDGGHRSSSRRHGSSANDRTSSGRNDRSRNGDQGGQGGGNRSRDDYRSSRGGRPSRDRDGPVRGSHGSSSSRGHGYTPY
ncbi:Heteroproteinous nuclear ribonucleoprotein A1 [Coemansia sp. BCRC 34301]|nr:Heteroproteinous nuclear ribonucleoprotein A1 [Coemansia sp. BCRC 34301]